MLSRRIPTLSHVTITMQTLILPDWNYPRICPYMTDAKR
jgi:hypothetical protein